MAIQFRGGGQVEYAGARTSRINSTVEIACVGFGPYHQQLSDLIVLLNQHLRQYVYGTPYFFMFGACGARNLMEV